MAACEANYHSLCRLMPEKETTDHYSFQLPGQGDNHFHLRVLERTAYTRLVEIYQSGDYRDGWVQMPHLKVRMYRDARLAEVVAFEGVRGVRPRNAYPNNRMHQPDEKAQWNGFLEDWLRIAIRYGYAAQTPCVFSEL